MSNNTSPKRNKPKREDVDLDWMADLRDGKGIRTSTDTERERKAKALKARLLRKLLGGG